MRKRLIILIMLLMSNFLFAIDNNKLNIKEVEVNGIKEVPIEVIKDIMILSEGTEYNAEKMIKDHINLKEKKYIQDVKIYPEIEKDGIKLVVEITEMKDSKELLKEEGIIPLSDQEKIDKSLTVKRIEVIGNSQIETKDLMKYIPVKVGGYFSKTKTLDGKNRLIKSGYFREVKPEVIKHGDGIYISYTVIENPVIKGIKIEGNTLFTEEELVENLNTKVNSIYNVNELRSDKDLINQKYSKAGYGLARVIDMQIDEQLNLIFKISEGIVRDIVFKKVVKKEEGQRRSPDKVVLKTENFVLEREIKLEKGKPFKTADFENTARSLFRLGLFKNVTQEFESIPGDPDGKIIVFLLDEQRTAQYQGTISYGSAVGVVGSASVEDTNFRGKGQSMKISFEYGQDNAKTYELSFNDPWLKGTERLSYGWSIYRKEYSDEDSKDLTYNVKKIGYKLSGGKGLTDRIRFKLTSKIESVEEKYEDSKAEKDNYKIVSLTPTITYDTRNNYYTATKGFYAAYSIELGKILDENNFTFNELELRKFHKGFFEKNTFAYRTILGVGSNELRDSQKYRVGGGNSIRGYSYGDFKGNYQFYANIENRTKLDDTFEFVLFYDAGRAWDETSTSSDETSLGSDIKQAYGLGLRIQTPIGPLRFDYGWPIDDKDQKGGEFYFNIGHTF